MWAKKRLCQWGPGCRLLCVLFCSLNVCSAVHPNMCNAEYNVCWLEWSFFVCVLGARRTEVAEVTAEGESGSWTEATQWRETETRGAPKKARTSGDWEEASYGQDCCSQENNCGGKGSERLDRGGDAFFFFLLLMWCPFSGMVIGKSKQLAWGNSWKQFPWGKKAIIWENILIFFSFITVTLKKKKQHNPINQFLSYNNTTCPSYPTHNPLGFCWNTVSPPIVRRHRCQG